MRSYIDPSSAVPITARMEAVSFVQRDEQVALLWTIGIFVPLFPLFLMRQFVVAGAIFMVVAAYRSVFNFCTLFIAWTKRPVADVAMGRPCLIAFPGGEGYPADPCYFTAYRFKKGGEELYCAAFPVRMDNVFGSDAVGVKRLQAITFSNVYVHPLNQHWAFAHDKISLARRVDLALRGLCWVALTVFGGLIVLI